ncbi:hypothetical protein F5Y16DRAFT_362372 [Xylariaceae sp. FL0255]|nr:hypothetical protein F5Y16DRAFT_362372 [Xylariaceae sp. FL0255]
MESFGRFRYLPPELRIQIWREHLLQSHGTQIHVVLSAKAPRKEAAQLNFPDRRHISINIATNGKTFDTLKSAMTCRESWAVFKELPSFCMGIVPMLPLLPSSHGDYKGVYWEEASRSAARFAIDCDRDLVYFIDNETCELFEKFCIMGWMQHVKRVAFQIINFQSPGPHGGLVRWAAWQSLIINPKPSVQQFLCKPELEEILLVVVASDAESVRRGCPLSHIDEFGFAEFLSNFAVFNPDELDIVERHAHSIALRLRRHYPTLEPDNKIRCVLDASCDRSELDHNYTRYQRSARGIHFS